MRYICGYCFSIIKVKKKTKNPSLQTKKHINFNVYRIKCENYSCYGYFNYKYKTIFSKQKLLQFTYKHHHIFLIAILNSKIRRKKYTTDKNYET